MGKKETSHLFIGSGNGRKEGKSMFDNRGKEPCSRALKRTGIGLKYRTKSYFCMKGPRKAVRVLESRAGRRVTPHYALCEAAV